MKDHKFKILMGVFAACLIGLFLQSFAARSGAQAFYAVAFTPRTITNGGTDTLYLPKSYNLATTATNMADIQGRSSFAYFIKRVNTSGTTNVGVWLQESGALVPAAADWVTVDSTALSTATSARISGAITLGRHQRLIFRGRGATQVTTVTAWATLKGE